MRRWLVLLLALAWCPPAEAAFNYYRQRRSTDCTALTDMYFFDLCTDTDNETQYTCQPASDSLPCTSAEIIAVGIPSLLNATTHAATDLTGTLLVTHGGTGALPTDANQVPVSTSTSVGAWVQLPSSGTNGCSDANNDKLLWDTSLRQFTCGSDQGASGGDMTAVGNITAGAAFTSTVPGTSMNWTNATGQSVTLQMVTAQLTQNNVIFLPNVTGVLLASGHNLTGDVNASFTQTGSTAVTIPTGTITSSRILDGAIQMNDLSTTNAQTSGYCLTSSGSSSFTWAACGTGGSSPFQTTSNVANLVTSGDTVTIGSATAGGKLFVDGDANEIQLQVQQHSTQTADSLVVENSSGTDLFTVDSAGNLYSQTALTLEGATANAFEGTLQAADVSSDQTWTLPDATGTVIVSGHVFSNSGDVTGQMSASGTTSLTIGVGKVTPNMLIASNAKTNSYVPTYQASTGQFQWAANGAGVPTDWDAIGDPATDGTVQFADTTQTLKTNTAGTAIESTTLNIEVTNDATTDSTTQTGLAVGNGNTTGGGTTETGALIYNGDADSALTTGLAFDDLNGGGITTALDASDAAIGTALAIGGNSISMTDGALIDMSAVNDSSATEGLILPLSATCASATAAGQICIDTTLARATVGTGTIPLPMNGFLIGTQADNSATADFYTGLFAPSSSSSEDSVNDIAIPYSMACKGFSARLNSAPTAGTTFDVTLRSSGVNTGIGCQITNAGGSSCSDTTNAGTLTGGFSVTAFFDETGSAATPSRASWTAWCWRTSN